MVDFICRESRRNLGNFLVQSPKENGIYNIAENDENLGDYGVFPIDYHGYSVSNVMEQLH